ncbi:MAG: hypothetical protein ACTSXJ_03635 [Candidatus Baldrarchaeia archaeon]
MAFALDITGGGLGVPPEIVTGDVLMKCYFEEKYVLSSNTMRAYLILNENGTAKTITSILLTAMRRLLTILSPSAS